jgi:hypothetical protein
MKTHSTQSGKRICLLGLQLQTNLRYDVDLPEALTFVADNVFPTQTFSRVSHLVNIRRISRLIQVMRARQQTDSS